MIRLPKRWNENGIERDYPHMVPVIKKLFGEEEGTKFIEQHHDVIYGGVNSDHLQHAKPLVRAFKENWQKLNFKERAGFLTFWSLCLPHRIGGGRVRSADPAFEEIGISLSENIELARGYGNVGYGWDGTTESVIELHVPNELYKQNPEEIAAEAKQAITAFFGKTSKYKITGPYLGRWGKLNCFHGENGFIIHAVNRLHTEY